MTDLTCENVRELLLAEQRGDLQPTAASAVHDHLQGCTACAQIAAEERVVSELLHARLARPEAPAGLRGELAARVLAHAQSSIPVQPTKTRVQAQQLLAAGALAVCAVLAGLWWWPNLAADSSGEPLLQEAVNDHLRVLYAARPVEIESGGIHQVKPWFSGRIDFAPDVTFGGDDDFALVGGAVGYVLDRKAATFVFKRRLHTITLLVFRADQLPWPDGEPAMQAGSKRVLVRTLHGFHALLWQAQGLGHVLISDVRTEDLRLLCTRLDTGP